MKIIAKSKINLYLRVVGKRPDNYHEIETLFLPINDPADELEIEFIEDGKSNIRVTSDVSLPEDCDNLCGKAALAVFRELGVSHSIRIFIRKRIPVTAGMGGGSSDAAAVIRSIQQKYGALPDGGFSAALSCGADVPFFLNEIPAIGRGVGEILTPVSGLKLPKIKIVPMNFPVSAAWAYKHLKAENDTRSLNDLIAALRAGDFPAASKLLRNDLANALWEKFPILQIEKEKLIAEGASAVQITGSGPTLFALYF